MTHESPSPLPTTTEGTAASAGAPRSTAARWLPVITSVLCIGLMGVVLALATGEREDAGSSTPTAGTPGPGETRDAGDLYGTPSRQRPPAGALLGCGELDPSKPPRLELEVDAGVVDFGTLKQGVKLTREVTFRSTGVGPLCVVSAKSSCGCLKAAVDGTKRIYLPGETGIVRLAVDTTGRSSVINKRVTITSNDPKSPLMSFRVKMDISAGLMSDPQYLQFGNVPPETSASRTVYLRTKKDAKDWTVTGVRSVRKVEGMKPVTYTYELEELDDPRYRRLKVRVIHPGLAKTGSYHDRLVVSTTHPERPEVNINAHIHVVPRIVFRARTISLGFVRAGTPRAPTRARIQAGAPGITFAVTGAEIVPPAGEAFGPGGAPFLATFGKDARGWWVDVKYDGKSRKAGLIKAILLVRTDDPEQPELRVPIRATLQAAR